MKINNRYRINNIKNPSFRIILMTFATMLAAIGGLLFLGISQSMVSEKSTEITHYETANKEYISKISQDMSQHQAVIFQYIVNAGDSVRQADLKQMAEQYHKSVYGYLNDFHKNTTGTEYEPHYHSIYKEINGYFSCIDDVYYFAETGDIQTANYYMEKTISNNIEKLNSEINNLDTIIADDLESSESSMDLLIEIAESSALGLILIIILLSVFTLLYCFRISDYMMNKDPLTYADNYHKIKKDCRKFESRGVLSYYTGFFCNIKDFKYYNQNYGSKVGDRLLAEYAKLIAEFLIKDERFARNGGDNFIVLIKNGRENDFISYLSGKELTVKTDSGQKTFSVESRCGICKIKKDDTASDVFNACNMALTIARLNSTPDIVWYKKEMMSDISKKKEILNQCMEGLRNNEFLVYYQPKVNMDSSSLCGCEALVRWLHDGKLISPGIFIPVLESEDKINELDFYVFRKVCSDISEWVKKGITPVRVSSNFSKNHLKDKDFSDKILQIINEFSIDPKYIEVELTESSAYDDFNALTEFVNDMKSNGIYTSMDDFGTGYSSLSLLKDLNVDVIKIDKSFIDDIDNGDTDHEKMVENVVHMIQDLHRNVICEGVETRNQASFLKSINCNMAQGYLYDKPLSHDDFEKRLESPVYNLNEK